MESDKEEEINLETMKFKLAFLKSLNKNQVSK